MAEGREAPVPQFLPEDEIDLREVLRVLRRRWWVVALSAVVFVALAWVIHQRQVPEYTASALLRKEAQRSPLEALGTGLIRSPSSEAVASQIQVLLSNAVLLPVVDSLGLRVKVYSPRGPRSAVVAEVRAGSGAVPAEYTLREGESGRVVLEDDESGEALAEAGPGGWLEARGFGLRLPAPLELPAELEVVHGETAVDDLRRELSVSQVRETSLIRVRYTDPDPELAAAIVGTVANVYQDYAARKARDEARRRRAFIASQLAVVMDSLQSAQLQQLDYQERSGTLNPETEGEALIGAVMAAESQVRLHRYHEALLTTLNRSLNTEGEADDALRRTVALGSAVVPGAETLYGRLQDLQAERSRLTASRYGYTAEGAEVEVVDSLIADTKREMREVSQQALQVIRTRLADAENRVVELRQEVRRLPERSTEFMRLRQQADAIQATYDLLAEKYYEAQIAEAVEGGDVEIVDPPTVPVLPEPSSLLRNLVLVLMLGMMVGTGAAFGLHYFDRKVRLGEDAEHATGVPVLSTIPVAPSMNGVGRPTLVRSERSRLGEAFRSLYTMIRFSRADWPRVLAVTSSEPAAGKSTVAANLALIMAGNHPRVLVLDADFPRPIQHSIFGVELQPGLSEVLVGAASLDEAVQRSEEHGVDILAAGTPVPHSADLLASDEFRTLMERLRGQYDVVIIDTPPTLALADTTALAPAVDGILLVARIDRTDRDALATAAAQLRQVGGKPLGVVLNWASSSGGRYGYGYGYDEYVQGTGEGKGAVARFQRLLRRAKGRP